MPHMHDQLNNKQFTFKSIDPQNACMHFLKACSWKKPYVFNMKKKYKIDAEAFVNNNSHIKNENNTAIFKKNHLILNVRLVHPYITDR